MKTTVAQRNNVTQFGKGTKTLMFAHGYGCDQNMWRFITPEFKNDYKIVLFDHVGSGQSDTSAYDFEKYDSLHGYAEDIVAICDELKFSKVVFNKELKAFTYVSSHDLQEPLRKLQTFAGLILDREKQNLSDKGQHYFELMQRETERMRQLIHDLLSFSGISVGERKFEKIELNSIVEEVKGNFKDLIAEKNAVIEIHQTCLVYIIPFQFRQLMNNLIGNALKYSQPERPPHIIVKSRNVKYEDLNIEELSLQTDYCQITISDNGIGFEQKFSSKIFEVLQKLHGKDEYPGTGIGLAIVKKIVDNHNGYITATSTLNNGATFTIFIPISQKNK